MLKRLACLSLCLSVLASAGCGGKPADRPFTVGFMPKLVGIPYFTACQRGAEEAAKELNIKLVYDGPNAADAKQQLDLLNHWVAGGEYDCLVVACNNPDRVAPALKRAREKGILIVTYDADTQPDARQFFVNMATYDAVAHAMVDALAEELEPKGTGKVAILTSSVQAPNQNEWARRIKAYVREKYPKIDLLDETEHGEDRNLGVSKARALIQRHDDLKGILGLTSVAVPAAAEAVRQEKEAGKIVVTGVSTPKDMREYVEDGTVKSFILWSPVDLGYLSVYVADLLRQGKVPENGEIQAGRLGKIGITNREVLLGKPIKFTKENVAQYDF